MSPTSVPSGPAAPPAIRTSVPVEGMTCRSCERRIERRVARLPGVTTVSASAARARVDVVSEVPVSPAALADAIEAAGYRVGRSPWLARDPRAWLTVSAGLLVVALLVLAAGAGGLPDLAAGAGSLADGGLLVAALVGLAAGFSTCMALTGGLVLALSASFTARHAPDPAAPVAARLRPTAVFVAGRVAGYGVLGAALGVIGSALVLPPLAVATLMLAAALTMTILGVRLTGLSPRLAAWSPTLPAGVARSLGVESSAGADYGDGRAAVLGAATFFLPCGFTQAVQVYALSTGNLVVAGLTMAAFALGTAPGLLALGGLPALLPGSWRTPAFRLAGVAVLAFALLNATAGLRLAGISPDPGRGDASAPPQVTLDGGMQTVRTFQVATGYLPASAALYAGIPTRWIIESLEDRSCAVFLQVPALGISVTLRRGENTIDLPALPAGRIDYTCSMGMYGGQLTVVEPPQGSGIPAPGG